MSIRAATLIVSALSFCSNVHADELNPKFDHKLDFYERLTAEMARRDPAAPLVIAGDLNVAPS